MSILVDETTRILVQGITGTQGRFHTRKMLEYGSQVVAGVTPGKGGSTVERIPVFDTVAQATAETAADAALLFVPPSRAADAMIEAADAGIPLIVCLTEGIPTLDVLRAYHCIRAHEAQLIGPNTAGVISPGKTKLGVMAGPIHRRGPVGVMSRSGTLSYEIVHQLSRLGVGQSTCVGIGGDVVTGLSFAELLPMFEADDETAGVILVGEIGGSAEQEAAAVIAREIRKPVVSYIAGRTAPAGRRMGHAGAIITGATETAQAKRAVLEEAGVTIVDDVADVGRVMARTLG